MVDCTFGAGGHARLVAERIGVSGTLVCIDRDPAAEDRFAEFAAEVACETRFLRMDYAEGLELLGEEGLEADLVYLDLGISSMQVDARERGFSYSYDAPLDMRMDTAQELDARAVVNDWDERQLAQLFSATARTRTRAGSRARSCVAGARTPIETTGELVAAIEAALPAAVRRSFGGGHPAKRVFQAVRIAVNARARVARPRPAAGLESSARGWALRRDLVPLARGPARQALPGRAGARLRLPARLPRLRVRARARGGAAHQARGGAQPRRGGRQPAGQVGPAARRPQAGLRGRPLMGRAAAAAAPRRATAHAPRTRHHAGSASHAGPAAGPEPRRGSAPGAPPP